MGTGQGKEARINLNVYICLFEGCKEWLRLFSHLHEDSPILLEGRPCGQRSPRIRRQPPLNYAAYAQPPSLHLLLATVLEVELECCTEHRNVELCLLGKGIC